jgi:hypothetical protein
MATVTRPRTTRLVNPAKRNWSLKQLKAGFGGKRRQTAARHRKRSNTSTTATKRPNRAKAPKRHNIAGIAVAGLPAGNPAKRRKTNMAKSKPNTSRRPNSRPKSNWRHKTKKSGHRPRSHKNPGTTVVTRWRTRNPKKNWGRHRGRKNPGGESTGALLKQSLFGAGGAVLSRLLPQWVLGASNTGIMGYGSNIAAGLMLAWAGNKFLGKGAGSAILAGAGIALVLRLVQDFTPWGSVATLSGVRGDVGMGALLPSNFVDPSIMQGNGAMRRLPQGWGPPPPAAVPATAGAAMSGMKGIPNTYGTSVYGR